MKYDEIYKRIELAAECIILDMQCDEREPEELAAEGFNWEELSADELAKEIGMLITEQFTEVDTNLPTMYL